MADKHNGTQMPRNDVASCVGPRRVAAPIIADQPAASVAAAPPKKARRSVVVPGCAWRRLAISHIGSITTAAANRRWRSGAPRHSDSSEVLKTVNLALISRPVPTAATTPEPFPTSSMTDRCADPPKIRRAPAHAARGSPLPPAATPIVNARGRYPMNRGSIIEAPLTASRHNLSSVFAVVGRAVGARAVPGRVVACLASMPARVVGAPSPGFPSKLRVLGIKVPARKNCGTPAQARRVLLVRAAAAACVASAPRLPSGVVRNASTSATKAGQAGSSASRM